MKLTPENLRITRTTLGITQGELARMVGVTNSFISAIERTERTLTPSLENRILVAFQVGNEEIQEFVEAYKRLTKHIGGV